MGALGAKVGLAFGRGWGLETRRGRRRTRLGCSRERLVWRGLLRRRGGGGGGGCGDDWFRGVLDRRGNAAMLDDVKNGQLSCARRGI